MNQYDYALPQRVSAVMRGVYVRMTFGLIVSALTALIANVGGFVEFMRMHSFVYWGLLIAEVGIVIGLSARLTRMKSSTAAALFYLFAAINGLTLSTIFAVYSIGSLAKTFFITAGTFAGMSLFGYTTKQDLTKFGTFFYMLLWGLIICIVVNMFVKSGPFDLIISIAGVVIFVGLTAWDTQQIKRMAQMMPADGIGHLATIGALNLYLDFINLFLYLLRFFGSSRD